MVLAIDQGTSGTTCLVVDGELRPRGRGFRPVRQYYPRPGWVEHDPEDIWQSVVAATEQALFDASVRAGDVQAIGITNQRETTLLWDRRSGEPVQRAIVWQDRRTAERCRELPQELIRARTGLVPDPYFSATKLEWVLRDRGPEGLAFGTVDSWLVWKLTAGRVHATDLSNASRTLVFDIHRRTWDDELLGILGIPRAMLPSAVRSSGVVAETDAAHFGSPVSIAGIAGDQQAALFGQGCFEPGEAKNTYGTGCFLLVNTGTRAASPGGGLVATLAWDIGDGPRYALEGSAFITGAAVQWLRDGLGIIASADETEALATSIPDNAGVYLVPAFTGLGAPHWDPYARGLLIGIERGTSRAHIARATLESIAYQTRDLVETMRGAGQPIEVLRVDGGGTANRFLMQFQADVLGIPVEVAAIRETTALGAAFLAGLGVGLWKSPDELRERRVVAARYEPAMSIDERDARYAGWLRAVERARGWAAP